MSPGGSGVLLGDGKQVASPLDDLAVVTVGDPIHPLAIKMRRPAQRHRPGELHPPAMLASKGPPRPQWTATLATGRGAH
jgi:hypothetical protein